MSMVEGLIHDLFKEIKGIDIKLPLLRMIWNENK
jgi:aspartyl-tRNA synthetase